jgi:hypothetical protein
MGNKRNEERAKFVDYIAAAIRYASQETGSRVDFNKIVIILPTYSAFGADKILGMTVLTVDSLATDFAVACQWDCNGDEERAVKAIREYQELYPLSID